MCLLWFPYNMLHETDLSYVLLLYFTNVGSKGGNRLLCAKEAYSKLQ